MDDSANLETLNAVCFLENQSHLEKSSQSLQNGEQNISGSLDHKLLPDEETSKDELSDIMPDSEEMIYKVVSDENGLYDVNDLQLQPGQTLCEIDDGEGNITYQLIENGQVLLTASQEELVNTDTGLTTEDVTGQMSSELVTEMALATQNDESQMSVSLSESFSSDLLRPLFTATSQLENEAHGQLIPIGADSSGTKPMEANSSDFFSNQTTYNTDSVGQTRDWGVTLPNQVTDPKSIFRLKVKQTSNERPSAQQSQGKPKCLHSYYQHLKNLKQQHTASGEDSDTDDKYKCPGVAAVGSHGGTLHTRQYATVPMTSLRNQNPNIYGNSFVMVQDAEGNTKLFDRRELVLSPSPNKPRPLHFPAPEQICGQQGCLRTPIISMGNVALNSSGSEEDPSPPNPNRTWASQPTMHRFRSASLSEISVPTAAEIQAAFLQVQSEPLDPTDLCIGRQQHNAKERARRARIKIACDQLRMLIPGMTGKTDKATVFEFAVQYLNYLRSSIGEKYDKDFLQQASVYEAMEAANEPN